MKLIYFFLFVFVMMLTGYLFVNDFNFDNISFSDYLINTLFILLLTSVFVVAVSGIMYLIAHRRKSSYYKDIMTIRQYYDYKSAR
jgi:ABC-type Fe3+ transport system permease subunit